jgi:dihydropteroate synthase
MSPSHSNLSHAQNTLNLRGRLLSLEKPLVMTILNLTPDSFFADSRIGGAQMELVCEKVRLAIQEGATLIDIGGQSTRPDAPLIDAQEELRRVLPCIKVLKQEFPHLLISIDTFRAQVAQEAIEAGAAIINDVFGGSIEPQIWDVAAQYGVPYILTHARGMPQTMQSLVQYENVVEEVYAYFQQKIAALRQKNVSDIILDVGFGFAKTVEQNYQLLDHLDYFTNLGLPLLAGLSRKSMIYKPLQTTPQEALFGTIALQTIALQKGAKILRTHDTKPAHDTIELLHQHKLV